MNNYATVVVFGTVEERHLDVIRTGFSHTARHIETVHVTYQQLHDLMLYMGSNMPALSEEGLSYTKMIQSHDIISRELIDWLDETFDIFAGIADKHGLPTPRFDHQEHQMHLIFDEPSWQTLCIFFDASGLDMRDLLIRWYVGSPMHIDTLIVDEQSILRLEAEYRPAPV